MLFERPSRFFNWYWTSQQFSEATRDVEIARAKALGADLMFILEVTDDDKHANPYQVNRTRFPSGINSTAAYIRKHGLQVGFHTEPIVINVFSDIVKTNPAALMPEGLAPTYRSGCPPPTQSCPPMSIPCGESEDIGFWWGHQREGGVAYNGNPRPCGQSTCNCKDWGSNDWAPDMRLVGAHWSALGAYRNGSSIGFDGVRAHGIAPHHAAFGWLKSAITLGMVVHESPGTLRWRRWRRRRRRWRGRGRRRRRWRRRGSAVETLATKAPLATIEADHLVWQVTTSDGRSVRAGARRRCWSAHTL